MTEFGRGVHGEGERILEFWVSHRVPWLHSASIILVKGYLAYPACQKCSQEKKVLSFLLTLSFWDLDTKGLGDRRSFNTYLLSTHSNVPGDVVRIRDIEGNQKFKGFTPMELHFMRKRQIINIQK